jgi:hypothetical protein
MPDAGLDSQQGNDHNPTPEVEHQTRHRDGGTEGGVVRHHRVARRWAVRSCHDLRYDTDYHPEQDSCQHTEGETAGAVDNGGGKGAAAHPVVVLTVAALSLERGQDQDQDQ